jgi:Fe-S cluster biogenesis protein NfuA
MSDPTPIAIASSADPTVPVDVEALEAALDYIRPAIQADGGDIILLGVDGSTVNLQMVGACGGCPLSMMTLKAGIERILQDRVPGVERVIAGSDFPATLEEATAAPALS